MRVITLVALACIAVVGADNHFSRRGVDECLARGTEALSEGDPEMALAWYARADEARYDGICVEP